MKGAIFSKNGKILIVYSPIFKNFVFFKKKIIILKFNEMINWSYKKIGPLEKLLY